MSRRLLTGWGRTAPTAANVIEASAIEDGLEVSARGLVARGLGRSYNDAAQNAGGDVLDGRTLGSAIRIDADTGRADVEAGASLEELMAAALPHGWFVPVTPGTRSVTVGGAIAADIHGKNHHVVGSFTEHVEELDLVDGRGRRRRLTWDETPEAMAATAGGMGLTGVVTRAVIRLVPVETSRVRVDTERLDDLDAVMARMIERDREVTYSVAWIDLVASGRMTGRSVLTTGDFATRDELGPVDDPLAWAPGRPVSAPPWVPGGLLNQLSIRTFNEAWFRKAPRSREGEIQSIETFFHPLDRVRGWNRLYGPPGFLQWQCVVPDASDAIHPIVGELAGGRCPSFLAVLKRFGAAGRGHLSFPAPGWTLALDVPAATPELAPILDRLDEIVVAAGGRVYLAKDARVRPDLVPAMYPRLDEWRDVRDGLDPDRVFTSDLDRRLDLTGRRALGAQP